MEWFKDDILDRLNKMKLALISEGERFLDLFMINPDLPPARILQDKLIEACIKPANHRYAVSRGIRKLREAFCFKYESAFGVKRDPEREVCVTMGTKDALPNALLCLRELGFGDRVLLGAPTYPAHLAAVRISGMKECFFDMHNDASRMLENFRLALLGSACKIVLFNFPNNPTGICVDSKFYSQALEIARSCGAFVLNDFVYGEMQFGKQNGSSLLKPAEPQDLVAETYSLSKAYSVAGWRVAALLGQEKLISALARLKSQLDYGNFLPLQIASAAALTSRTDLVSAVVDTYFRRLTLLARGLKGLGWEVELPGAGASLWARYPARLLAKRDSEEFGSVQLCLQLLQQAKVLVMPGVLFGRNYDGYLRFALVVAEDQTREVLERIEMFSAMQSGQSLTTSGVL